MKTIGFIGYSNTGKTTLIEKLIPLFKARKVHRILDFGAGALRHCFPLLEAGFEVCAVEFQEGFARPTCQKALEEAQKYGNFSALIWPKVPGPWAGGAVRPPPAAV